MIHDRYRWQAWIVGVVLLVGFLPVGRQLVLWQVIQRDELAPKAGSHLKKQILEGYRGSILDAHGEKLAISIPRKTLVADAMLLSSLDLPASVAPAIVRKTAEVLGVKEQSIWDRLNRNSQYVVIMHKVDEAVFNRLTNEIARLDFGVDTRQLSSKQRAILRQARQTAIYADEKDEFVRYYPNAQIAAHVLGYVDDSHKGITGIEKQFDGLLRAYDGTRVIERNAFGEALWIYKKDEVLPHDGFDVQLTIDQVVQTILEDELQKAFKERQPDSVVGIVMRPRTGEILAMAACPTFNPGEPGKKLPGETELAMLDRLRNRCIADVAEPGSTFKIVTVAGALDKGVVTLQDSFDCHMPWFFCGVPLRDSHHYGNLTVKEIITKSSNIGAGKIAAMRLGQQGLYNYMRAFSFGDRTGIQLPGEVRGIVHPTKAWSGISIAHIPMGHEVAVTPLQMITAMSAIANGGLRMQPMIVSGVRDRTGQLVGRFNPKPVCQVIRKKTADLMVEALTTVTEKGGTGTRGAVRGFDVAAKTGTAQKLEGGHYVQKYYSSFVGFFPARQPEISILISMDNPHDPGGEYYGGAVAAPVFQAVAERVAKTMSVRPDRPEEEIATQTGRSKGRLNTAQHHAN